MLHLNLLTLIFFTGDMSQGKRERREMGIIKWRRWQLWNIKGKERVRFVSPVEKGGRKGKYAHHKEEEKEKKKRIKKSKSPPDKSKGNLRSRKRRDAFQVVYLLIIHVPFYCSYYDALKTPTTSALAKRKIWKVLKKTTEKHCLCVCCALSFS